MMPIVSVKGLTKKFKDKIALNQIDFQIQKGEIFGFLGPSGSGKTTTINILTGQINFDKGEANIFGKSVHNLSRKDLPKIGIVSDTSGFYEKLSLYKNIELYSKIHNVSTNKVDELLKEVGLYDDRHTKAEKLSAGMKQRMLLVRALINSPEVLFLDEPTSGLDPTTSKQIHSLLNKLKREGVSIFLTTHDMDEATKLCDNIVLLHNGNIVEKGTPFEIINKYNKHKLIKITYIDNHQKVLSLDDFEYKSINEEEIVSLHTLEPTLEDVFIELTGVKLNAQ